MFFVGLGHSHIVALAKGAYALQAREHRVGGRAMSSRFHYLYDPPYEPPFIDDSRGSILNPQIGAAICDGDPCFILTSLGGNEHNVLAISLGKPRFDFILGAEPDLPLEPRVELLPEAAIREALRDWMREKIGLLAAICKATSVPIIQIEPPPPLPKSQVTAYPKEFFRSLLDVRRMSSELVRYKMWRLQTEILRECCAQVGVKYVETPDEFVDKIGMLAAHAWGKDATHANERYGEEMIKRAVDYFCEMTTGAA